MSDNVAKKGIIGVMKKYKTTQHSKKFPAAIPLEAALNSIKQQYGEHPGDGSKSVTIGHQWAEIITWRYI